MVQLKVTRGNYTGYTVLPNPADANLDMDGFDITDADDYIFRETGQEIRSTSSGIGIWVPSGDVIDFVINSGVEWTFNTTEVETNGNDINFGFAVNSQNQMIESLSTGLDINLPNGDDFDIWIDDAGGTLQVEYTFSATSLDLWNNYLYLNEITAPGNGAANTCRLYCDDNGSGKTRLMAVFSSGAAQQVAIQP